jgi:Protein ENHANCED DISEASE RESISTANCE 2, C-terminal
MVRGTATAVVSEVAGVQKDASSISRDDCTASTAANSSTETNYRSSSTYENVAEFVSYVTACGSHYTTCVGADNNTNTAGSSSISLPMHKASVSRRSEKLPSPAMRPRSAEPAAAIEGVANLSFGVDDVEELHKNSGYHHRAMSDPFDTPQQDAVSTAATDEDEDDSLESSGHNNNQNNNNHACSFVIPTLARYPLAETRDKNCWSEPPVTIFSVRGGSYFTNQKKVQSDNFLLRARGSDIFLTDSKKHVALDQMYVVVAVIGPAMISRCSPPYCSHFPSSQDTHYSRRSAPQEANVGHQLSLSLGLHEFIL